MRFVRRGNWAWVACLVLCALALPCAGQTAVSFPFDGVKYLRVTEAGADPQLYHLVEIDLSKPGVRFKTTASNGGAPRETQCQTTRAFVEAEGAQIGVNANYFVLDEEEHTDLLGLAVSEGTVVSPWDGSGGQYALNLDKDNEAAILRRAGDAKSGYRSMPEVPLYNTVTGMHLLIEKGRIIPAPGGNRHPRTAAGLTAEKGLLLLVVDGRQPKHCVGMTLYETAKRLQGHGAVDALALDGGGSSTLVFADPEARVVNAPMPFPALTDARVMPPGYERANGNNLAVFAAPKTDGPAPAGATREDDDS